jgi:hypothetical protein
MEESENKPHINRVPLNVGLGDEPTADNDFMRRMEFEKSELNSERARFEIAFVSHKRTRKTNGKYEFQYVQHAFEGWIERAFSEWNARGWK